MAKFPVVGGKKMVAFFKQQGLHIIRQRGSHITMKKDGICRPVVVQQKKELDIDTIKNNLKTACISEAVYRAAMQGGKKHR